MIVFHSGDSIPVLPAAMDTADIDWIYVVWDNELADNEEIQSSAWSVDTGVTVINQRDSVGVTDTECQDVTYTTANGVKISFTQEGLFKIENEIVISNTANADTRTLNRAFKVMVCDI
jgi:hypothetical protein